jgi:hypothetical protein
LAKISLAKRDSDRRLESLKSDLSEVTAEMRAELQRLDEDIGSLVADGLRDEVDSLRQVVADFDEAKFVDDPAVVHIYVQQMFR